MEFYVHTILPYTKPDMFTLTADMTEVFWKQTNLRSRKLWLSHYC